MDFEKVIKSQELAQVDKDVVNDLLDELIPYVTDLLDDVNVQGLITAIWDAREKGVSWDSIYENIEIYEVETDTMLDSYERKILIKAMKVEEQVG